MKTGRGIGEEVNNSKIEADYCGIPRMIRRCIDETIKENRSQCLDPIKAKGNCLRISHELMFKLSEVGKSPFVDCKIIHSKKPYPHFWLLVEGWHIDLTAKQFNSQESCPKIWKHETVLADTLYTVEKGKGEVLFKLVPLNREEVPSYRMPKLVEFLRKKLRKVGNLLFSWKLSKAGITCKKQKRSDLVSETLFFNVIT
jgi:hypothetical protein